MTEIKINTDSDAKNKLHGLKIGWILFESVKVEKGNPAMDALIGEASRKVAAKFANSERISEDAVIKGIRRLFSSIGLDPTKERSSGEALIRRITGGKGLYRINTVVDVNNVISMTTGYPCGVYDCDKINGAITLVIGKIGEKYSGIGGRELNAENRLLTKDKTGIFGGPTADSERTSVTLGTRTVLMLVYHPSEARDELLNEALETAKNEMARITKCCVKGSGVYGA